jgi:hypothetical protein
VAALPDIFLLSADKTSLICDAGKILIKQVKAKKKTIKTNLLYLISSPVGLIRYVKSFLASLLNNYKYQDVNTKELVSPY